MKIRYMYYLLYLSKCTAICATYSVAYIQLSDPNKKMTCNFWIFLFYQYDTGKLPENFTAN